MLVGYARVSTPDQSPALQHDALRAAGCEKVFTDTASGGSAQRNGLDAALDFARSGDTLVVWRLDRLGRSLRHLLALVTALDARQVGFRSLTEALDTTTPGGRLVFHVFGALAEFERDLLRERTQAGLAAARARGRRGGRPRALTDTQLKMAQAMLVDRRTPVGQVCAALGVSRATLYRYLPRSAPPGSITGVLPAAE